MNSLELKVYDIFKTKFGEKEATTLIEYFEAKAEQKYDQKKDVLATKEDITSVKLDISALENMLVKQMYWINIVQFLATAGALVAIIKFMMH